MVTPGLATGPPTVKAAPIHLACSQLNPGWRDPLTVRCSTLDPRLHTDHTQTPISKAQTNQQGKETRWLNLNQAETQRRALQVLILRVGWKGGMC